MAKKKKAPKIKTRRYPVDEKCIIGLLRPKGMSDDDWTDSINLMARRVMTQLGIRTMVVGVDHWKELRVISEIEIEKLGFVHKDRVFLLKEDVDMTAYTPMELEAIMSKFVVGWDEEE